MPEELIRTDCGIWQQLSTDLNEFVAPSFMRVNVRLNDLELLVRCLLGKNQTLLNPSTMSSAPFDPSTPSLVREECLAY